MFIVPEGNELPDQFRKFRAVPFFVGADLLDIGDDCFKISAAPVDRIGLLAGAIDRTGEAVKVVFDQRFENSGVGGI